MLCVRCSHPLSPRADRCLRCFALNPPSEPVSLGTALHQPPPAPFDFDLSSEPPARELTMSISSDPPGEITDAFGEAQLSIDSEPPPQSGSFRIARDEVSAPLLARAIPDTDPEPVALTEPNPVRVARQPLPVPQLTKPFAKPPKPVNLSLPFELPVEKKSPVASGQLPAGSRQAVSVPVAPAVSTPPRVMDLLSKPFDQSPVASSQLPVGSRQTVPVPVAPAMPASVAPALQSSVAPALRTSVPAKAPESRFASVRASGSSRLAAWAVDFGLLFLLGSLQILLAARLTNHDWLDLALSRPLFPFWMVLLACDAIACSWLFASAGRTPGMLLLGQRLRTLDGGLPTPGEALQRALLSLLSAAPALFGFSFALFDSRGQTLHDKLCGCIVTID